ncbi:MAG: hypothetical protein Ta2A_04550 [Treponemataceae bacterium]|nr:MAG: hypothetical protein Ta2A_04550 [Treponemataceae bacterium]
MQKALSCSCRRRRIGLFLLLLLGTMELAPSQAQVVGAITDVNGILHKMDEAGAAFDSPKSISSFIDDTVRTKIKTDFIYRINFIGWVASQYGLKNGTVTLIHLIETNNALESFLKITDNAGGIKKWTHAEISKRYEKELQEALTASANENLFMLIFDTYLEYKRGELGW